MERLDSKSEWYVRLVYQILLDEYNKGEQHWDNMLKNDDLSFDARSMYQMFNKGYAVDLQGMKERMKKGGW